MSPQQAQVKKGWTYPPPPPPPLRPNKKAHV